MAPRSAVMSWGSGVFPAMKMGELKMTRRWSASTWRFRSKTPVALRPKTPGEECPMSSLNSVRGAPEGVEQVHAVLAVEAARPRREIESFIFL